MKLGDKNYMLLLYAEARSQDDADAADENPLRWMERMVAWYDDLGFDGDNLVSREPEMMTGQVIEFMLEQHKTGEEVDLSVLISSAFSMGLETGVRLGKARWDT